MDYQEGAILGFDKPLGWTSFALVGKVRWLLCRHLGIKKLKVGHAGTLDPLATGVLVVCTGRATKRIDELQAHTKEYVATLRLGATTPSYDLEKPIDREYPWQHITRSDVERVLSERFTGTIEQVPPIFSACKVNGDRAYDLARKGQDVELKPKLITIEQIELTRCELPDIEIRVVCSKGTYIRSLARDIGEALGSGAHLTALRRTRVGDVRVEECYTLEQFEQLMTHPQLLTPHSTLPTPHLTPNPDMKLSQFKIKIPETLFAQYPMHNRDESRLMVLHAKSERIEHREHFKDILEYFDENDVFVFNDTQVFPARLYGNKEKTGARIEVFLLRELNPDMRLWDVLVDPARKIRIGNKLYFGPDDSMVAEVIDNTTSRGRTLRFLYDGSHDDFKHQLYSLGEAPLPAMVGRPSEPEDLVRFQTIYARNEGAVTAPCSGLHFSRELMKRMEIKGIDFAFITMHCGLGNFRDIDVEDLSKHKIDSEELHVKAECCQKVNNAYDNGRKVCGVGISTMRTLEAAYSADGHIKEYDGWTNKFIFPPYQFKSANAMVVNFYPSQSTMLMLTSAFGGYDNVMKAYKEAVKMEYRFGTYGDAMLIMQD